MGAAYPNNIFFWSPRVDQVNIVFANDVNTLATEIQGIETTLGTLAEIEFNPPAGTPQQYPTISSRISAANNNALLPYAQLFLSGGGFFINQGSQVYNNYTHIGQSGQAGVRFETAPGSDPYNIWSGTIGTVPCTGVWLISTGQRWNQQGNNFRGGNVQFLYVNGSWVANDIWNWDDFFGDTAFTYAGNVTDSNGFTTITWLGLLNKGDRLQILSANSTFCPGIAINDGYLNLACLRTISGQVDSTGILTANLSG